MALRRMASLLGRLSSTYCLWQTLSQSGAREKEWIEVVLAGCWPGRRRDPEAAPSSSATARRAVRTVLCQLAREVKTLFETLRYIRSPKNQDKGSAFCFCSSRRLVSFGLCSLLCHGFWPLFMKAILFKIMSEEYREKCSEKYSDSMVVLKIILN